MSTNLQNHRPKVGFFSRLGSHGVISSWFRKLFSIIRARKKGFVLGAVILFVGVLGLFLGINRHFWQVKALAQPESREQKFLFPTDNEGLIEESAEEGLAKPNLTVSSLIYGSMPGVYQIKNPDPFGEDQFDEIVEVAICQQSFLAASASPMAVVAQEKRNKIVEYQIKPGDTVSSIAMEFGLAPQSILWANNLSLTSVIKADQKLVILPVDGTQHTVGNNETVSAIAKKYKAKVDDIIVFNSLPADGQIKSGQELIIPGGIMPAAPVRTPLPSSRSLAIAVSGAITKFENGLKSYAYPFGYCTWYVAQRRYIPWSGNAISWLDNAKKYGFSTGKTPVAGAIIATKELPGSGHVAYVESVSADGKWITISEMNAPYWGKKTVRTLPTNYKNIRGYIY